MSRPRGNQSERLPETVDIFPRQNFLEGVIIKFLLSREMAIPIGTTRQ